MSTFRVRHIGPDAAERDAMLEIVGVASLDILVAEAIPGSITAEGAARPAAGAVGGPLPARPA